MPLARACSLCQFNPKNCVIPFLLQSRSKCWSSVGLLLQSSSPCRHRVLESSCQSRHSPTTTFSTTVVAGCRLARPAGSTPTLPPIIRVVSAPVRIDRLTGLKRVVHPLGFRTHDFTDGSVYAFPGIANSRSFSETGSVVREGRIVPFRCLLGTHQQCVTGNLQQLWQTNSRGMRRLSWPDTRDLKLASEAESQVQETRGSPRHRPPSKVYVRFFLLFISILLNFYDLVRLSEILFS